ncbi:hypothetical protein T4B_9521 [Trichinella pseudospiralis]|uniref:Uncharacterized protein n=2 Tax=Trichinella pseudospiralis TaxID=6337 RepID=A0A0V1F9Q3_TRIPS|nr:hypothetical protein T4D_3868 [Trichinella pseudospiralis]KRZ22788.1 hypothetical protein T4B_9521 [Trichinella pseudospiralis]
MQAKLDDKRLACKKLNKCNRCGLSLAKFYWIIVKSSRLAAKQDDKKNNRQPTNTDKLINACIPKAN